ncbi:MAG: CHRD domain-containing protein [Verrucomicrobia subdivision 3 bacterium]|nr:CHRD domain-containing protein [Limisphaerales bacterium]
MRAIILLVLGLMASFAGKAQQPIQFTTTLSGMNAVPPNGAIFVGTAQCSLIGSEFRCRVKTEPLYVRIAEIRGPARAGMVGPLVFPLVFNGCQAPLPPVLPFGECYFVLRTNLTQTEIESLFEGLFYITVETGALDIRGQILPVDSDRDAVPDFRDVCPDTASGDSVTAEGCSVEQLCPCAGPWKNHGEYVNCVKAVALNLLLEERISAEDYDQLIRAAAKSDCGKKNH